MNDTVFLRGLEIDCVIGAYEEERAAPQTVVIDLDLTCDVAHAARRDELDDAIDWSEVARSISDFVVTARCRLVETLAVRVADLLLNRFEIEQARVRIRKPGAARYATEVGVEVVRTRADLAR